ncbi:MAG: class I SAM-dependent RNA methyltransferase [Desulfuromonadales bacterium]|nr:class I SAM-dependent RNA methyltransferase [Desulfuromonadales bacterium]
MKVYFEQIFAVTAPGLEEVCAEELRNIIGVDTSVEPGGVRFSGGLRELYLVNLHARIASRFLVYVGAIRARDFSTFYKRCVQLPWGRYLKKEMPVLIRASSRSSRLVHTGRLAETIEKAIHHSLGSFSASAAAGSGQLIVARMEGDLCRISIDSSGELLHRRGYRLQTAQAPLRETLAAGILKLLKWEGETALVDPMCGSGTFLIEGALIASHRPAGAKRGFAFMDWPRFRPGLWSQLQTEGERLTVEPTVTIQGSDADASAVEAAGMNLHRAGCFSQVALACRNIAAVKGVQGAGLVICNPPYGLRVGRDEDLVPLYRQIGDVYRQQFAGWKGALLCPPGRLADATGLKLKQVATLLNGGLRVTLFKVDL